MAKPRGKAAKDEAAEESAAPVQTAQGRYEALVIARAPYEQRGREAAALTIPALIPPAGSNGATTLPAPYQSIGARGVNNLAAKLLLVLFPPGSAFFKLVASEKVMDALKAKASQDQDVVADVETALSKIERSASNWLSASNLRSTVFELVKHLIVGGNGLICVLPEQSFKFFPLSSYVCKRDLSGTPVEIITKESLSRDTLPPAAYALVTQESATNADYADATKPIDLYTWLEREDNGAWKVHQEVCGKTIPKTEGTYPKGKTAWLPQRWAAVSGEDYGRGLVEEYFGDLYSAESLSQSLAEGSAALAKVVFLVDEAGVTSKKKISEAQNLDVIDGNAKDISVLRTDKSIDLSVAQAHIQDVERRLSQAFLLTSSIQRDAERVTAEEIRVMASELEQALGGVYSMFAQELQRPLVDRVLFVMKNQNELPQFPDKSIVPQIVTGLEGLGRNTDLTRLDLFIDGIIEKLGPQAVQEYVAGGEYMKRRAAALSLDVSGLIRSEQEVQAQRAAAAQAAMAQHLGPDAIKANAARDVAQTKAQSAPPSDAAPSQ